MIKIKMARCSSKIDRELMGFLALLQKLIDSEFQSIIDVKYNTYTF